jgi:hypothetical protein
MKSPIKVSRKSKPAPAPPNSAPLPINSIPPGTAASTGPVPVNGGAPNGAPNGAVTNGAAPNGAAPANGAGAAATSANGSTPAVALAIESSSTETLDLERRRAQLAARVAELQWDLGGLVYEMAVRNRMHTDVLVKRAAVLQDADAELGEIERILRLERTGVAALCLTCGAPHSTGAVYCWQCGTALLEQVPGGTIAGPNR